ITYVYVFKYVSIIRYGLGSSCMDTQSTPKRVQPYHTLTISVAFGARIVNKDHEQTKLYIWKFPGQLTIKSITRSSYRNGCGLVLVLEVCKSFLFSHLTTWLDALKEQMSRNVVIIIIG
uniref:Uncharacterized protein n=1 Tax=Sus scrofa TaxID=9823 RepID=A0A4X1V068_PIG